MGRSNTTHASGRLGPIDLGPIDQFAVGSAHVDLTIRHCSSSTTQATGILLSHRRSLDAPRMHPGRQHRGRRRRSKVARIQTSDSSIPATAVFSTRTGDKLAGPAAAQHGPLPSHYGRTARLLVGARSSGSLEIPPTGADLLRSRSRPDSLPLVGRAFSDSMDFSLEPGHQTAGLYNAWQTGYRQLHAHRGLRRLRGGHIPAQWQLPRPASIRSTVAMPA